jgi:uracil-DNA glycosylase
MRNIPKGWDDFFESQLEPGGHILSISKFISTETKKELTIYPSLVDIYTIFKLMKPENIKIVIIGQDPYINQNEAHGISFSVRKGIRVPPSLQNIYSEVKACGFTIKDETCGDLTRWCEQGVFLINASLTVEAGKSGSHMAKWEDFTSELFLYINQKVKNFVVIAWGRPAKKLADSYFETKHIIFSTHPSPLSAHNSTTSTKPFIGSKPFIQANTELVKLGCSPVDWSL